MAKQKEVSSAVSIRRLSEKTGIPYMKIRDNLIGKYNSLKTEEKTTLVNAFHDEVTPFLKKLGYFIQVKKLKED